MVHYHSWGDFGTARDRALGVLLCVLMEGWHMALAQTQAH